ncbi:MAG: hypothetical protein U0L51_08310, partial [Olegusella sp.]|nr:hypothetical protein [Olegusella sp.]
VTLSIVAIDLSSNPLLWSVTDSKAVATPISNPEGGRFAAYTNIRDTIIEDFAGIWKSSQHGNQIIPPLL